MVHLRYDHIANIQQILEQTVLVRVRPLSGTPRAIIAPYHFLHSLLLSLALWCY
jgi:hypothetical protein